MQQTFGKHCVECKKKIFWFRSSRGQVGEHCESAGTGFTDEKSLIAVWLHEECSSFSLAVVNDKRPSKLNLQAN